MLTGKGHNRLKLSDFPEIFAQVDIARSLKLRPKIKGEIKDLGACSEKILWWNCSQPNCILKCKVDHVHQARVRVVVNPALYVDQEPAYFAFVEIQPAHRLR